MTYTTTSVKVAKTGIQIGYVDDNGAASTQNLNFDNKTLSLDNGIAVVAGNASMAGDLAVSGGVNMGGVAHIEGAASMASTLNVSGASHLHSTLLVDDAAHLASTLLVDGNSHLVGAVVADAAVSLGSTLDVTGASHLASTLLVDGNSHLVGVVNVDGQTHLHNTLSVDGASHLIGNVAIDGTSSLGSTLTVTGATTLNNGLTVNGTSTTNGAMAVSGAVAIGGAITVAGASSLGSTMNVAGASHLGSTLLVDGISHFVNEMTADAAVSMGSTLNVTGAVTMASTLSVNGTTHLVDAVSMSSTLDVAAASHLASTLLVDGASSLGSTLDVAAASHLHSTLLVDGASHLVGAVVADAPVSMGSTLNVTGAASMASTLLVNGASHLASTLLVDGASSLGSTLAVSGNASMNSDLTVAGSATIQQNMTVNGNLTVLGVQTSINTVNLEVKDNAILIANENNADAIQSGVMVQYKPTGAVAPKYAGLKRLPGTGEFVFYKDAITQLGYNGGSTEANIAIDNANLAIMTANTNLTAANVSLATANNNVATTLAAKTSAAAAIPAYVPTNPLSSSVGEYITIDYGTPTQTSSFTVGSFSGWTHLKHTAFYGSNDNAAWNFIVDVTFNRDVLRTVSYSAQSWRYLRIVFESLDSSYWGANYDRFSFGLGGTMASFSPSQISLSAGLTGMHDQNGGALNLQYFQISAVPGLYVAGSGWNNGTGAYTGSNATAAAPSGPEYDLYVQSIQPYQTALNTAISNYNAAVSSKTVATATVATATAALQSAQDALVAAHALAATLSSSDGVYATVLADGFTCASDAKLKKDVVEVDGALEKVSAMRGVYYHWIAEEQPKDRQVGVIAQEVHAVVPELVHVGAEHLSVDYPKLTAVLIQAIKELKAEVDQLKAAASK